MAAVVAAAAILLPLYLHICIHLNMSMQLLPPRAALYEYTFIEQLVKEVNRHAKEQGERGGRGGARGGAAEGQNVGVLAFYMGSFEM